MRVVVLVDLGVLSEVVAVGDAEVFLGFKVTQRVFVRRYRQKLCEFLPEICNSLLVGFADSTDAIQQSFILLNQQLPFLLQLFKLSTCLCESLLELIDVCA